MSRPAVGLPVLLSLALAGTAFAAESRFAVTNSRSEYVHWIELYDAANRIIDVTQGSAAPYSPRTTCGRCHDYEAIVKGHHFNAMSQSSAAGRPGEPWIWTDPRTGTQLPLSYRDWPATYNPNLLGITPREFVLKFGRQLPGAGPGAPDLKAEEATGTRPAEGAEAAGAEQRNGPGRQRPMAVVGPAGCGLHDLPQQRSRVQSGNSLGADRKRKFRLGTDGSSGIGQGAGQGLGVAGRFRSRGRRTRFQDSNCPKPLTASCRSTCRQSLPRYRPRATHSSCYYCHSIDFDRRSRPLRNGPTTKTFTFARESPVPIATAMALSITRCAGLRASSTRAGRMSVRYRVVAVTWMTRPAGGDWALPSRCTRLAALHLEKLSCTACHSGPRPAEQALQVQTAMAHGLGLPSHDYTAALPPGIVEPVMMRDGDVLYPHRMMWPAFWGSMQNDTIRPLNPERGL